MALRSSLAAALALTSLSCSSTPEEVTAAQLPPRVKAQRSYPRLMNYFHRMDFPEAQVEGREDYLAQWDVIVVNPQNAEDQGLDLARIREVNPAIRILAWIPFGQSSLDMEMSTSMPHLDRYFVKEQSGARMRWPWGGYFMNPYTGDPPGTIDPANLYAFPRHVVAYVTAHYLVPGGYDGVMFDCIWAGAPRWFASSKKIDVNGDGVDDWQDDAAYVAGIDALLTGLREAAPGAIITANPGDPWGEGTSYYQTVDGLLMENALGDEWRSRQGLWENQWASYRRALAETAADPRYVFVGADLRWGRTQEQARVQPGTTAEDLRRLRLALGMTLLGDGYFGFDRGDGNHGQLWWFPEYDVDLGSPLPGYQAPDATWRSDVYGAGTLSREFTQGTVIVNPTSRGVRVTLEGERVDASTQEAGTAFDLPPGDARMYVLPQP